MVTTQDRFFSKAWDFQCIEKMTTKKKNCLKYQNPKSNPKNK